MLDLLAKRRFQLVCVSQDERLRRHRAHHYMMIFGYHRGFVRQMGKRREDRDRCSYSTSEKPEHLRNGHLLFQDELEVHRVLCSLLCGVRVHLSPEQLGFQPSVVPLQQRVQLDGRPLLHYVLIEQLHHVLQRVSLLLLLVLLLSDLSLVVLLVLS